jgi:pilus assembly protein CpaC
MRTLSYLRGATLASVLLSASALAWAQAARPVEEAAAPTPAGKLEALSLAVGETRTLSAKGVRNYSLGLNELVDTRITPDGSQFVLVGKKTGTTTLLLIYDDGKRGSYEIQVTERSQAAVEQELEALLTGESGVSFRRIGGRFFLEGSVGTEAELKRIQQMAALYPDQVQSLVTVGGGTAADRSMLVRIDFFFVQYDKSSSYGVGLAWPASIGGNAVLRNNITYDFVAGTTTTAQASVVDQPLPRLDIASNHGWAKILRQASMLTSNGMEANFNSGGEQNFSVNTGLTIGVERISFGTVVTVLPRYDAKTQQVDLKLVSDISDLTAPASSTLPGRTYSRLTTNVRLKLGQALVLSGLHSRTQAHSVDGIPGLSEIPLLGLFFGSHSDRESATENAMFVIPSVVESVSNASLAMIEGALKQYDDYDGDIEQAHPFTNKPPSAR